MTLHLNVRSTATSGITAAAHEQRQAVILQDNREQAPVFQRQADEETAAPKRALAGPSTVLQRMPKGVRKPRKRAAKKVRPTKVYGLRNDPARVARRLKNDQDRELVRKLKVKKALKKGGFKTILANTIKQYENYPQGSYAHGRYLYLKGQLASLGAVARGQALLDFDTASVEIDHSPHDASQRGGAARANDNASMHRVAVPLPRNWHRRHKTTHGASATRFDNAFSANQKVLVENGNYAQALQNHLLDTFSDEAIGATGKAKVQLVVTHALNAVNYAASNIPAKIHGGHQSGTPAISGLQHAAILTALRNRIAALKLSNAKLATLNNPF